jgi:hypothetical protein
MSSLKDKPLKKCHTDSRKMIDDIHTGIVKNMTEDELSEYYLDNGLLLNEYYSNSEDVQKLDKGILNFFRNIEEDGKDTQITTRKDMLNKYLSNVDDKILAPQFTDKKMDRCAKCNSKLAYDEIEGHLICNKCGYSEVIIIVNEKGSYNDQPREANYFAYKRINHFNEWLAQFQAKGTTELPDTIYIDVYEELDKDINRSINSINTVSIRNILKRLNYNKYYEHIPHLINVLTGKDPPTLSRKSEELLRSLFKEIQVPFMNNCPKSRKNFLSYSYVLHKFCELLEFDHLLPFFPFLKSREKLIQQDIIWEKICSELKWQYIPSS